MTRRLWLAVLALALLAPTALASAPRGASQLELAPPSLSLERALASDEPSDFALGLASLDASPQRFAPLAGVELVEDLAQDLRRPDEPSYPKTRIGGLRLFEQDLYVVSTPLSVEVRWGCEDFSCEIAEGDGVNLYAFVGQRPHEKTDPLGLTPFCLEYPQFCAGVAKGAWNLAKGIVTAPIRLMEQDYQEQIAKARAYNQGGMAARQQVAAEFTKGHNEALKEMVPGVGSGRRLGEAIEEYQHSGLSEEFGEKLVPAVAAVATDVTVAGGVATKATRLARAGEAVAVAEAGAEATAWSDAFLQKAVDDIHFAEFKGAARGRRVPMTLTATEDGRLVLSQVGRKPGPRAMAEAARIFGEGTVEPVRGGVKKSGHHAEVRGINYVSNASGARQASTHNACAGCAAAQEAAGVTNVTGTEAEAGRITRSN